MKTAKKPKPKRKPVTRESYADELNRMADMTSLELEAHLRTWMDDGRLRALCLKYQDDMTAELMDSVEVAGLYVFLRERGQAHNFAEMVATKSAPGTKGTDRAFWQAYCNGNQFANDPKAGEHRKRTKNGGKSVAGKFYHHGVGEWISDLSDLRYWAHKKRMGVEGIINIPTPTPKEVEDVPLAENIVKQSIKQELAERPELNNEKGIAKLRREVLEKHTPRSKRHLLSKMKL